MTIFEETQKEESYYLCAIFECLDGCDCPKGKNRCKLISHNERIPGETTFAEMYWKHIEEGGDPDVF